MPGVKVIFYDKADGTKPAKDFINGLDKKCGQRWSVLLSGYRISVRRCEDHILHP